MIPRVFDGTDATVYVGGTAAENVDYVHFLSAPAPYVVALVLVLTLILLTIVFRSIVISATAVLLNLLSVGAAYGLLVLVFQHGVGAGLFGFTQYDTIEAWVPLFLFSVLFGLSMDYQVFLLSRIRERYLETNDTKDAVAWGVASTARLITGAALIIVVVFLGFAMGDLIMFQQMGFGVAVALLIDATVIRSVLVPAAMTLLGKWNWYLPSWLNWLPELHIEGRKTPAPQAADTHDPPKRTRPVSPCAHVRAREADGISTLPESLIEAAWPRPSVPTLPPPRPPGEPAATGPSQAPDTRGPSPAPRRFPCGHPRQAFRDALSGSLWATDSFTRWVVRVSSRLRERIRSPL